MYYNRRREEVGVYIYDLKETKEEYNICYKVWAKMSNYKKIMLRLSLHRRSLISILPVASAFVTGITIYKNITKPLLNQNK